MSKSYRQYSVMSNNNIVFDIEGSEPFVKENAIFMFRAGNDG